MTREQVDAPARFESVDRVVELGIGERTDLAVALARSGVSVTTTDLRERSVPSTVGFVRDDLTDPDPTVYVDADLLYARRLPAELHEPARRLARRVGVDLYFTTLGFEAPEIPVERHTVGRATWYVSRDR